MSCYWSKVVQGLTPYVPGEQPKIANLVKLNTNESPFGPSPLALEAMRAAANDTLRLYPDPEATELRAELVPFLSLMLEAAHIPAALPQAWSQ